MYETSAAVLWTPFAFLHLVKSAEVRARKYLVQVGNENHAKSKRRAFISVKLIFN